MNIQYNAFQTALNALLLAHKEHRKNLTAVYDNLDSIEGRTKAIRDFGTVRVNIGQRSGKTVWVQACSQEDWLVISTDTMENVGHKHCQVTTKEQLSKALHQIINGFYRTIVIDEPWHLERGDCLDKNFNKIMRAMATSGVPLDELTLIVLG